MRQVAVTSKKPSRSYGTGSLRERPQGSGHWELRAFLGRDQNGRPVQRTRKFHGGKREAQRALRDFVTEAGKDRGLTNGSLTVGGFLDEWLAYITPLRQPGTVRGYATIVRRLKDGNAGSKSRPEKLGDIRLDKLTAEHLDRAYAAWLAEDLSSTTVHHTHVVLATALHQAVKWRRISHAVTDEASPPKLDTFTVEATNPTVIGRLIAEAEEDYPILAAAIALAAITGCRRGELCGLKWSDIEYMEDDSDGDKRGVLHVQRAVKHGVDRAKLFVGPTKSRQDRRIALDPLSVAVLTNHRANVEQWAAQAGVKIRPDGFIFGYDPTGTLPIKPDTITEQFRSLTKRLGIKLRFHDLRHFTATQLIGAHVDPRTVADRLGHRDPSITMRVYTAQLQERDREAAEIIGSIVAGQLAPPVIDVESTEVDAEEHT
jgi:integrase